MTVRTQARLAVAARVMAAFPGGYALTSLMVATASLAVPDARHEMLPAATLASFLLYAAIIMAVFHARTALRAWLWLIGIATPPGAILILLTCTGAGG